MGFWVPRRPEGRQHVCALRLGCHAWSWNDLRPMLDRRHCPQKRRRSGVDVRLARYFSRGPCVQSRKCAPQPNKDNFPTPAVCCGLNETNTIAKPHYTVTSFRRHCDKTRRPAMIPSNQRCFLPGDDRPAKLQSLPRSTWHGAACGARMEASIFLE